MKQVPVQSFVSECGKAKVYVENDMPIGVFHDFLLMLKGSMVERMVEAQKQEKEVSDKQKDLEKLDKDLDKLDCDISYNAECP